VEDVRASLKPGEVFVSFFSGGFRSFVWRSPKRERWRLRGLRTTLDQIDDRVSRLRAFLRARTSRSSPTFPSSTRHRAWLYNLLLKPVEGTWRGAKTLVVASNAHSVCCRWVF
jgi:hypothetical protein